MSSVTPVTLDSKVLVLGAGFGGLYTVRYLSRKLKNKEEPSITLVNNQNYFLFSPILHEVATGVINAYHITYPITKLGGDNFKHIHTEVEKLELERKQIVTSVGTLDYDYLVIALGSVTKMPQIQNEGQHIFTMKTLQDAVLLRNHLIQVFEQANVQKDSERVRQLLTFVISGGGYTGVQLTATLTDVLHKYFTKYYKAITSDDISIILVEAEGGIIHNLDTRRREYIMRHLHNSGVQVMLNSRVTRAMNGTIEINGNNIIHTNTLVWATGIQANPRVFEMNVEKDSLGRLYVNDYLQLPEYPDVYVVGDCCHFRIPRIDRPATPRAHHAVRQAEVVAHNIAAELRDKTKRQYNYTDSAEVMQLGRSKALLRVYKTWIYGLPAIFFYVISYSSLAVGVKTKLLIMLDWLLSRAFGPDITLLE